MKYQDVWPMGRKCPQKIVKFLFLFETSKNDHCRCGRWGCKCPCPQFNVPFSQKSKMPFYSWIAIFPELSFYFPEVLFCFPEVSFYLMCVFQMVFFQGDCTFYLSCSELLRETTIALLLKPLHGVWFLMHFIQVLFSW